jgi:hypothetical protein
VTLRLSEPFTYANGDLPGNGLWDTAAASGATANATVVSNRMSSIVGAIDQLGASYPLPWLDLSANWRLSMTLNNRLTVADAATGGPGGILFGLDFLGVNNLHYEIRANQTGFGDTDWHVQYHGGTLDALNPASMPTLYNTDFDIDITKVGRSLFMRRNGVVIAAGDMANDTYAGVTPYFWFVLEQDVIGLDPQRWEMDNLVIEQLPASFGSARPLSLGLSI